MRALLFTLFFIVSFGLFGQNIEETLINEQFRNVSLNKVIRKLRNKYDVNISYDDALISGVKVTGKFENISLKDFLNTILKEEGIDYEIANKNLILVPRKINVDVNKPSLFDINVFGIVRDAMTGESLPNALIRVDGETQGTISNKDGYFRLSSVPTDTSTIEVRYLGYQNSKIKLQPGQTRQTLQIMMVESALELSDFEVVDQVQQATRYGDDISQITINPKSLTSLPSLGELDVFRSLQFLPGISGTNETSSALSIRSSPSSHNLVLFDGFTIYRLDHFFGVFSAMNADAIRDIQVYKGGYGAKYGGRISGVVDMAGNTGSFVDPNYSLGINLLSAKFNANVPLASGRGALHFNIRRAYTDVIRSNLFEKLYSNYRDQSNQLQSQSSQDFIRPDFSFYDLNLKASYKLTQSDILSLSIYTGRDNLESEFDFVERDEDDPSNILGVSTFEEIAEWGNRGIGFTWSKNWSANYYSQLQVAQSDHYFNYFFEDNGFDGDGDLTRLYRLIRNNDVKDLQVNFSNEINYKKRHTLTTGFNYSNVSVLNRAIIETLMDPPTTNANPSDEGNTVSFYLEDQIRVTDKLRLKAGLRYNFNDISENNYFTPRVALNYNFLPNFEFKAAYGQYVQLLQEVIFDDPLSNIQNGWFLSNEGNRDPDIFSVDVMTSDHIVAGFQYKKDGLIVDLEYFHKDNEGLNEFLVSHIVDRSTNERSPEVTLARGTGQINGLDFLVQKSEGNYTGWLAYTYSRAMNRFDNINNFEEIPGRLDQRHEVKFVHLLDLPKWKLSGTWIYGSGTPFLEPEVNFITNNQGQLINYEVLNTNKTVTRLPAYHRLDLSAALKFGNQNISGELGLSVLNVYNRVNIQSKRLKTDELDAVINGVPGATVPEDLYRNLVLLDLTPSIFLNLYF